MLSSYACDGPAPVRGVHEGVMAASKAILPHFRIAEGNESDRTKGPTRGGFYLGEQPPDGVRCEDIIARKRG
jgi:hypothetical protein